MSQDIWKTEVLYLGEVSQAGDCCRDINSYLNSGGFAGAVVCNVFISEESGTIIVVWKHRQLYHWQIDDIRKKWDITYSD